MAGRVNRGEIWLLRFRSPDKRRPVLVLTRQNVIELIDTVTVAPITSTIRGAPGEVVIGEGEGLKHASAVKLDLVQTVRQDGLGHFVGSLGEGKMAEVCRAMAWAMGCSGT